MALVQRISLIACALLAALACVVAYGGTTQTVKTQAEGVAAEQPSFPAPQIPSPSVPNVPAPSVPNLPDTGVTGSLLDYLFAP